MARSTLKIAGGAISALIQTQGVGDLYQLYVICQRDGIDYKVTAIPESFDDKLKEPFDQSYMRKLFRGLPRPRTRWIALAQAPARL